LTLRAFLYYLLFYKHKKSLSSKMAGQNISHFDSPSILNKDGSFVPPAYAGFTFSVVKYLILF